MTVDGELAQDRAEGRHELEPVSREAGGEHDVRVFGVGVHDELLVARHGVHADGMAHRPGREAGKQLADEALGSDPIGRVERAVEGERVVDLVPSRVFGELYGLAV